MPNEQQLIPRPCTTADHVISIDTVLGLSVSTPVLPIAEREEGVLTSLRSELARKRSGHEGPRTTKLYDRTGDEITLDVGRSHYDLSVSAETAPLDMHSGAGIGSSRRRSNR